MIVSLFIQFSNQADDDSYNLCFFDDSIWFYGHTSGSQMLLSILVAWHASGARVEKVKNWLKILKWGAARAAVVSV